MSVAAMTLDDQRPLNSGSGYDKKPYDSNMHGGGSGPASPTPSEPSSSSANNHHHHTHHSHHSQHQFHHRHGGHSSSSMLASSATASNAAAAAAEAAMLQQSGGSSLISHQSSIVAEAVAAAEQRQRLLEDEIENLKLEQTRLVQQCADTQRREKILMRRLAIKEQEFQDYVAQIAEYKAAQAPSAMALRSALLDPAVNLLFEKLKKELKATKAKLEETQNELSAWKFTPDSNTGKRLMAKCRLLYQENEELGKMTSNGRLAKLETELAMQKSFSEEVKKSQSELDDFLQELDEDVEGMQSTILFLQQELKTTRDRIQVLEKENFQYKSVSANTTVACVDSSTSLMSQSKEPVELTIGMNDNNADVDMKMTTNGGIDVNDAYNINMPHSMTHSASEMLKYQNSAASMPLATIAENHAEYYNGCAAEEAQLAAAACTDDGSSRLPRKRNYEGEAAAENLMLNSNEMTAHVQAAAMPLQQHVASPRTLPPKKSKLRVAARRASVQSIDENMAMTNTAASTPEVNTPMPLLVGNEEQSNSTNTCSSINSNSNMLVDETTNHSSNSPLLHNENSNSAPAASNMPQRVMTRRRSVRQQQLNGDSNH